MSLLSLSFFAFVLITLTAYFILPKRFQWIVLLISSLVFYLFSGVKTILFLLFTTVSTYWAALAMGHISNTTDHDTSLTKEEKKERKAAIKHKKRLIVAFTLLSNFGILFVLKYYNFTVGNLNVLLSALGTEHLLATHSLLLPLGISFYIFQTAGYVIDVYRDKCAPNRNIFRYALFVSYFPQMVQGPISRYGDLGEQLYTPHSWDWNLAKAGIQLMLWGYFKKVILADRMAVLVDTVFGNYQSYGGAVIFLSVFFYCIQLYGDFSGGIDIIRGLSRIMGIELVDNFKRPYFSLTISEFWRRWHISLGEWMKDYLFYPLSLSKGFNRLGKFFRRYFGRYGKVMIPSLATVIVFLCVGLWQGASWKWVAYGLWNGGLISGGMLFAHQLNAVNETLSINTKSPGFRLFQLLRTLLLMCIGRYFSRATSLMAALSMMKRTVTHFVPSQLWDGTLLHLGLDTVNLCVLGAACLVLLTVSILQEKGVDIPSRLARQPAALQFAVNVICILVLVLFGVYAQGYVSSEFIYGNV